MSFRCRQKLIVGKFIPVSVLNERENENGEFIKYTEDLGKVKLPDPELFDINNQLKAGVDMEEVNSKVLKAKRVNADTVVRKYTRKEKSDVFTDN